MCSFWGGALQPMRPEEGELSRPFSSRCRPRVCASCLSGSAGALTMRAMSTEEREPVGQHPGLTAQLSENKVP